MPSTVDIGSYALFIGSSALSNTAVDLVTAGKIPTSSGLSYSYSRIYTAVDSGATLERSGSNLVLKTQEEGPKENIITDVTQWTLKIPVADVSVSTWRKLMVLNQSYYSSSGTVIPINFNEIGQDLWQNTVPFLLIHKNYQTSTDPNIPTIGTSGDPAAMFFTAGGLLDQNMSIEYDPKSQQIFNLTIGFKSSTGATGTDVGAVFGLLVASSSY
jgi:hypothetical protein